MVRITVCCVALVVITAHGGLCQSTDNWPHWRGSHHNGIVDSTDLPTKWSLTENIKWKSELPSWSAATPIIWGDRIFVTSPSPKATPQAQGPRGLGTGRGPQRDPGGSDLFFICFSKKDGKILWQRRLDNRNEIHNKHNDASPSPVTDGKNVWVVTGTGIVTAFDMEGNQIWQRNLQSEYIPFGHGFGYGSSPLLHDGSLIIQVLHGYRTDDPPYIVCLNAATGKEEWYQERLTDAEGESPDAYNTPLLLEHEGQVQIVISGGDYVTGHDRKTGQEVWRAAGLNPMKRTNYRIIASPITVDGVIYAPTRNKPFLALRAGGKGDVTKSHFLWSYEGVGTTDVPSPISDGKYIYIVDDRGLVTCLDRQEGSVIWGPEWTSDGIVSASPILAGNRMYILNERAVTTVAAVGEQFKILATNELDGTYTLASPAVSGSQIFIRTSTHLYCIGE